MNRVAWCKLSFDLVVTKYCEINWRLAVTVGSYNVKPHGLHAWVGVDPDYFGFLVMPATKVEHAARGPKA